jgi:hypothetical protein
MLPLMTGGWLEDIHDPHNWYVPYLTGTYAYRAQIPYSLVYQYDQFIEQGVATTDFAARHAIYQQLNQLVYDTAPLIILGTSTSRNYIQRGVTGQVLNQAFPGNYYYPISKVQVFNDVPPAYWAWNYIERVYAAGITGGCTLSPFNYCPGNSVTRAQMAIFLLRAEHGSTYTPPAATGTMFADVPLSSPTAPWIEQLANEQITGGCGGGNYCPNNPITRAQMAIFLLRAKHGFDYVPPAATGMFLDVPKADFTAPFIEQLANEQITGGCGGGNYCPGKAVTRDQMAIFLVRTFKLP